MRQRLIKCTILTFSLFVSFSAVAESQIYKCPSLHGVYTNDQSVGDWFFWADKSSEKVNLDKWSGQHVNERSGEEYNYGLVCHAGAAGPYHGVMLPVKAKSCVAIGDDSFRCE